MNVALFSSCIVDTLKPEIGFATLKLLQSAGCKVNVPAQSCCGQANYNNGDIDSARALAVQWLSTFEEFDYVVIPSGSCAAMLKHHSPALFNDDLEMQSRFNALAAKTYELSVFLTSVAVPTLKKQLAKTVCYHDSCSSLRELGVKTQPRQLLTTLAGVQLIELENAEACCGFGGTFCVKHPEISCKLADDKICAIEQSGATSLIGADWGCLMHLQGRIDALGLDIQVMHFSELLAQTLGSSSGGKS